MAKAGKIRRVDFYPDEFVTGVMGMGAEHIGAYWVVCSLMYAEGGPIDADDRRIMACANLTSRRWNTLKNDLIAAGKLTEVDAKLINPRVERELNKAQGRINLAQTHGQKGGRPRKENNGLAKPDGFPSEKLTTNQQPPTNNHIDKDKAAHSTATEGARAAGLTDPATLLIQAFDAGLADAGDGSRRGWPAATDRTTAQRLAKAGATPELVRSVAVSLAARQAAQNRSPPSTMKFAEAAILDALADANRPVSALSGVSDARSHDARPAAGSGRRPSPQASLAAAGLAAANLRREPA